ncbi:hypothetical protein EB796_024362 [Bugula neritina]|uniref:Uncharacterized protein n=1 Tax=Bugula neritina TaxID=10212 RepID=A0A7J7ITT6_BUGNE|nr:hypothetical protein EB796_024362 [Bugula neritina]
MSSLNKLTQLILNPNNSNLNISDNQLCPSLPPKSYQYDHHSVNREVNVKRHCKIEHGMENGIFISR